jgi:hypothetical protein
MGKQAAQHRLWSGMACRVNKDKSIVRRFEVWAGKCA